MTRVADTTIVRSRRKRSSTWSYAPRVLSALNMSRAVLAVTVCLVAACAILGGATRSGFLSDVIVQVAALPLLYIVLATPSDRRAWVWASSAFCVLLVALPMFQVLPLGLGKLDVSSATRPAAISISKTATWNALLALIPPIAVFLAVRDMGWRDRRVVSVLLVALAVAGGVLGLFQMAQGPNSSLRFYAVTNEADAVGFFANRNHLGAVLFATVPFVFAWLNNSARALARARRHRGQQSIGMAPLILSLGALVILFAAATATRSRAAIILLMVALAGSALIAMRDRRKTGGGLVSRLGIAAVALGVLLAVQYAMLRVLDRFAVDVLQDARVTFARLTREAALDYMPFGSGLGTFADIYPRYEKPIDALADIFANRAHNDWLELWLEGGIPALVLMGLFLFWLLVRMVAVWRRRSDGYDIDHGIARAAFLAIILLLMHSTVDYPLHTTALSVLFAAACAMLITAPDDPLLSNSPDESDGARKGKTRRMSNEEVAVAAAAETKPSFGAGGGPRQFPSGERASDWPQEWREPDASGMPNASKRADDA